MLGKAMKPLFILCTILACTGCTTSSPGPGTCNPPCQEWEECIDGECIPPACCPYDTDIPVAGTIVDIATMQGVRAELCFYGLMDGLTNPNPDPEQCVISGDSGYFEMPCQDPTGLGLPAMLIVDDPGRDGFGGAIYPTSTAIPMPWMIDNSDPCIHDAEVYVVLNTLTATLDAETSIDSSNNGFVIGLVVDSSGDPVAGAVIKKGDGSDLVEVIYPDATFTTFDGMATSESGVFVLPAANFSTVTDIIAEKDGMTFSAMKAAAPAGLCYFTFIMAN